MKLKLRSKKIIPLTLMLYVISSINAQTLDQSNTSTTSAGWLVNATGYDFVGQTFTAGITGAIKQVDFYLEAGNPTYPLIAGDFSMTIREGSGSGRILGTEIFSISGSETSGYFSVEFTSLADINVVAGNTYTFIIDEISGTGQLMLNSSSDNYAGGIIYYNPGTFNGTYDLLFNTYVGSSANNTSNVLFGTYFMSDNQWNITSGELDMSNNIVSTEVFSDMTLAFADFSRPLAAGESLELSFNSEDVTNFATSGWAGISLYTGGQAGIEQVFIGSPGNVSSWGIAGAALGSTTALSKTSEIAEVLFKYNYDNGEWSLSVDDETISGTIASGLAFDVVRIGADINNLADISVSDLVAIVSPYSSGDVATPANSSLCNSGSTTVDLNNSSTDYFYELIDDLGNVIDGPYAGTGSSMSFNTGTITSTTSYNIEATKNFGFSLHQSSDEVYIQTPFYAYGNEITVEAWVYPISGAFWAGQAATVDDMNTNVWLWEGGSNNINFYVNDNGAWRNVASPSLTPNTWTHVATVADASGLYIYFDGSLVASSTTGISSGIRNSATSVTFFGQDPRYPNDDARNSNGFIDNIKVWDIARSVTDVADDMSSCNTSSSNLVQYIPFNEGMGWEFAGLGIWPDATVSGQPSNNLGWVTGNGECNRSILESKLEPAATVTVNDNPINTVTLNGNTLTADEATSGATYQWLDCDNGNAAISGATSQSFSPGASGNYAVEVTLNGCASTSNCTAFSYVGIDDMMNVPFSIYPNPNNGEFTVTVSELGQIYSITDVTGKVIKQGRLYSTKNTIDITSEANGIYFLKVNQHTAKLIKK